MATLVQSFDTHLHKDAIFEPQLGVVLRGTGAVSEAMQSFAAMKPVIAYDGDPDIVVIDAIALVSNAWTMSALLPDCTMHRAGGVSGDAAALEQLVVGVRNRDFHPG